MARLQREYWKEAIREECNSILCNDMFAATATSMPTGNRPIGSKWVGIQDKDALMCCFPLRTVPVGILLSVR